MESAPSRIELLLLSTLSRRPMHGYELKLEMRYRHVRWWAKCEHGHLYAALARLERDGRIAPVGGGDGRRKRIFAVTEAGRQHLESMLRTVGAGEEGPYFDVDLFLAGSFTLPRDTVLEVLDRRASFLRSRLEEAQALRASMAGKVPAAANLIMDHRARHLRSEIEFTAEARETLAALPEWKPFLRDEAIEEFVKRAGVALEEE